jgi:hypothetical protein
MFRPLGHSVNVNQDDSGKVLLAPRIGSQVLVSRRHGRRSPFRPEDLVKKPSRPRSPWRDLAGLVWTVPLFALPVAVFFQMTSGQPFKLFFDFYRVSLVFAASTMLGVWVARHWLAPPLIARSPDDPQLAWKISALHTAVALVFGAAGAVILHFTILPGFLGSARAILSVLAYFVLFGFLSIALVLAINFYGKAMERAGSERELQLARRIQQSFLLSEFPDRPCLDVFATNVSSKEVSGDFYDVVPVGDDGYLLAVADVSGKGVPAALLSSMLQASLRTQASAGVPVAKMMTNINSLVCGRASTGQFATFFLAAVSERDMTLRFTNAGHNFPVLFRADGERRTLETGGLVVGMLEDVSYQEESVPLMPGDRLVLYTDGVTEAALENHDMFGEERLMALVETLPRHLPAREVVERVLAGLRDFLGKNEAGDDITVMALCVRDAASAPRPPAAPQR